MTFWPHCWCISHNLQGSECFPHVAMEFRDTTTWVTSVSRCLNFSPPRIISPSYCPVLMYRLATLPNDDGRTWMDRTLNASDILQKCVWDERRVKTEGCVPCHGVGINKAVATSRGCSNYYKSKGGSQATVREQQFSQIHKGGCFGTYLLLEPNRTVTLVQRFKTKR